MLAAQTPQQQVKPKRKQTKRGGKNLVEVSVLWISGESLLQSCGLPALEAESVVAPQGVTIQAALAGDGASIGTKSLRKLWWARVREALLMLIEWSMKQAYLPSSACRCTVRGSSFNPA